MTGIIAKFSEKHFCIFTTELKLLNLALNQLGPFSFYNNIVGLALYALSFDFATYILLLNAELSSVFKRLWHHAAGRRHPSVWPAPLP